MESFAWYLSGAATVGYYLRKVLSYCDNCWSTEMQLFLRTFFFGQFCFFMIVSSTSGEIRNKSEATEYKNKQTNKQIKQKQQAASFHSASYWTRTKEMQSKCEIWQTSHCILSSWAKNTDSL